MTLILWFRTICIPNIVRFKIKNEDLPLDLGGN